MDQKPPLLLRNMIMTHLHLRTNLNLFYADIEKWHESQSTLRSKAP